MMAGAKELKKKTDMVRKLSPSYMQKTNSFARKTSQDAEQTQVYLPNVLRRARSKEVKMQPAFQIV